jgi:hypothetical protein
MKTFMLLGAVLAAQSSMLQAVPLSQGTFTEIIHNVNKLATDGTAGTANLNEILKAPERVRTGADSRAELTAPDKTITRIGANTVFAFDTSQRVLHLDQGSVLFHTPKGGGGGTIKSGGASAAVLGTTIIVSATPGGGFKLIVLEGKAKATLENGKTIVLKAGQLVFVLPEGKGFSKALTINLGKLAANSQLVSGFSHPLPSIDLINMAIRQQNVLIVSGAAVDTGKSVNEFEDVPGNGQNGIDHSSHQIALHPNLTPSQVFALIESQRGTGGPGGSGIVPVSGKSPNGPN